MTKDLPESNSEVRPSRVTLKTVFTVCFGVLIVIALVMAIIHSLVAITLTYAALLLAVTLDHGVQMLVRRGLKRSLAIALIDPIVFRPRPLARSGLRNGRSCCARCAGGSIESAMSQPEGCPRNQGRWLARKERDCGTSDYGVQLDGFA